MSTRLTITRHIDSAHYIKGHPGKCKELHGHRWKIEIEIEGDVQEDTGMVIDFKDVKDIIDELDHKCLNTIIEVPTAENLAWYLYDKFNKLFNECYADAVDTIYVKVWESPDCLVTIGVD